jgi:hypothetical protein
MYRRAFTILNAMRFLILSAGKPILSMWFQRYLEGKHCVVNKPCKLTDKTILPLKSWIYFVQFVCFKLLQILFFLTQISNFFYLIAWYKKALSGNPNLNEGETYTVIIRPAIRNFRQIDIQLFKLPKLIKQDPEFLTKYGKDNKNCEQLLDNTNYVHL